MDGTRGRKGMLAAAAVLAAAGLAGLPAIAQETGESLFKTKCAACHGADGAGTTPMGKNLKVRDLRSADVQKQSDADLTAMITKGKEKMPAYETKLSKEQIAKLVSFVREMGKKK